MVTRPTSARRPRVRVADNLKNTTEIRTEIENRARCVIPIVKARKAIIIRFGNLKTYRMPKRINDKNILSRSALFDKTTVNKQ